MTLADHRTMLTALHHAGPKVLRWAKSWIVVHWWSNILCFLIESNFFICSRTTRVGREIL